MQVGVIGTGAMGAGMASRLLATGHRVHIRDIDPAREVILTQVGATAQPSPSALVAEADVVFIVVVTANQIHDVLNADDGLLAGLSRVAEPQTKTIFLCSTIAPDDTLALAKEIEGAGAAVIDAPISGGPARAYDGSMSIMIAAPEAAVSPLASLIDDIAARQFRVSSVVGDGARAKLVNNLAGGVHLAVAAEALALAGKLGLDVAQMQQLMSASSGQSWVADDRMPRALADDFEPRAATRVLTKDLTLATTVARQAEVSVPLGEAALASFEAACASGLSELDDAAMYTYYCQLASRKA